MVSLETFTRMQDTNMTTATGGKLLPNAEELFSEFATDSTHIGYTGDCGEFAELCAVHIVSGTPLTPDNMTAIVRRDIAHGWASDNGGEPLVSIAHDLDALKLKYTLFNYPGPGNWLDLLRSNAGVQPVIMEVANGQNLAGDEPGLHFHFVTVVGVDGSGNFLCCDGDNIRRDNERLLCVYTPDMISGAQPCGLIVVKFPQKDSTGYVVQEDGSIIYNANGVHLIGYVAEFVKSHNIQNEALAEEFYFNANESVTPFNQGCIVSFNKLDAAISLSRGGEDIAALIGALKAKG
jgi:hypothetical protein